MAATTIVIPPIPNGSMAVAIKVVDRFYLLGYISPPNPNDGPGTMVSVAAHVKHALGLADDATNSFVNGQKLCVVAWEKLESGRFQADEWITQAYRNPVVASDHVRFANTTAGIWAVNGQPPRNVLVIKQTKNTHALHTVGKVVADLFKFALPVGSIIFNAVQMAG